MVGERQEREERAEMPYKDVLERMSLTEDILPEDQFRKLEKYAERKAKLNNKPESYVELLLPDVVKEWLFSRFTIDLFNTQMDLQTRRA